MMITTDYWHRLLTACLNPEGHRRLWNSGPRDCDWNHSTLFQVHSIHLYQQYKRSAILLWRFNDSKTIKFTKSELVYWDRTKKSRQNFKIADFPIFGTLNYICYHKNRVQSIRNPLTVNHCGLIPFLFLSLPRRSHFLSPSCLLTYFVP